MGFFWYILGPRGSSEPHPGLSKCQRGSSKSFIILFVLLGSGLLQASPGWHTAGTSNLLCTPGLSKRSLWLTDVKGASVSHLSPLFLFSSLQRSHKYSRHNVQTQVSSWLGFSNCGLGALRGASVERGKVQLMPQKRYFLIFDDGKFY